MTLRELTDICSPKRKSVKTLLSDAERFLALAGTQTKNSLGVRFYTSLALMNICAALRAAGIDDIEAAISKAVSDEKEKVKAARRG